ncbi:MAG: metal-dependent hydrolase [Candidatus Dadabacteria bacterium]|nr:metal-dependent hydrolase [Candidatus Dadabacteria bacterium]
MLNNGIEITYLGHSTFAVKSPGSKTVMIDPWIEGNPSCPEHLREVEHVDIIAVTHGHFDHTSDVIPLCNKYSPKVVANWEICDWLGSKGVKNCMPCNKGGNVVIDGIRFTMTHAQHSSSMKEEDGTVVYGGETGGYIIKFENNYTIYHAGDTNIFGDMKLISEIYKPQLAMLPIGDLFTMSPLEASYACRLLNPKWVIPMHYGTFPLLVGTPDELKALTKDMDSLTVIAMESGQKVT